MISGELWARLSAEGLVDGDFPEDREPASPWYVRVMLGIAGWIGALFLIAFAGAALAGLWRSGALAGGIGAACCAGAFALFRAFEGRAFAEQFALALSLAGQALLMVGLADFVSPDDAGFYIAAAAVEIALVFAVPNFLHRVLASAGAAVALALAILQMSLHGLAAPFLCAGLAVIWLDPERWARGGRLWRPIGYGLVLALLLVETFRLFGLTSLFGGSSEGAGWMARHGPLIGRVLTAIVLVGLAVALSLREGHAPSSRTTLAGVGAAILIGLFSLNAPGFASALLVLLLGFAVGNRLLMALGVLSLLGFVSHFYYSLHATLLEKSALLAASGICLLAGHWLLRSGFAFGPAEADHA